VDRSVPLEEVVRPKIAGEHMHKLIELYEMVAMNDAVLRDNECQAIVEARFALGMFERAMKTFRSACSEAPAEAGSCLPIAA
jgi:hypothetical protein